MRNLLTLSTAVLLLASVSVADAQQSEPTRTSDAVIYFGYRSNSVDGDEARAERYRDLRSGVVVGASYNKESGTTAIGFQALNVGYNDQAYFAELNNYGKFKLTAFWNSTPLNYANNTSTPWQTTGNNVWTLDPTTRLRVQSKEAGVIGIGTNAAQFTQASIYRGLATPFEMQARRDILNLGAKYQITPAVALDLGWKLTKRSGNQPFGAAFAFNDGNELPIEIDDRTDDFKAAVEWTKPGNNSMLRLEWNGSKYDNEFWALEWDNPLRATDFSNGRTPPDGPWDASGYSNGNGPAFGRLALAPSSNLNTFSLTGLQKLPGRTTINGQVSYTLMKQDEQLIPWTTNANIANAATYAFFPGLASLPRQTADAEIRALNALVNLTMRPTSNLALTMKYRFNDRENRTPEFDASNNVRFDAVPEAVPGTHTRPYNIRRNTFETGATLTMPFNSALGVAYILDDVKRENRVFGGLTDYTVRISLDAYSNQYFNVRGVFENMQRVGNGFNEHELEHGGSQLGARFFDEAELGRNKGTVLLQITPSEKFDVGLSLTSTKDEYNGEEHEFGLLENSTSSYNVTFNVYPVKQIAISGNYGYDTYDAFQESRNANPVSGTAVYQSWYDENRNWHLDNEETVKSLGFAVDLLQALPKTDIKLSYDRSESDNAFGFGGPRIQELITNVALTPGDGSPCGTTVTTCFTPLPNVTNKWQEFEVRLTHNFSKKLGLGLGYLWEKLEINDFATMNLEDGSPRIDHLGVLGTGYGNRPYKSQVFTVQMNYTFQSAPILF